MGLLSSFDFDDVLFDVAVVAGTDGEDEHALLGEGDEAGLGLGES